MTEQYESKNPKRRARRRRSRPSQVAPPALNLALATILALAAGACHREPDLQQLHEPVVVSARTATAERLTSESEIEIYGVVEAARTAAVSARVMAMVTSVDVRAGDRVDRGQLLLELDPKAADGRLAQARGALAQAQAALVLAERNHQRYEALAATDSASPLELDTARMHFEQAKGAVEQATGAVRAVASIAADARVVAPFAGHVARRMVEIGDLAAPGRPLLTLESDGGRRLAIEVPERTAARAELAVGRAVDVAIDTRPELGRVAARLIEVAPGVDPATHTRAVKIELPIEDLASGSSGRAWIPIGSRSLVVVPQAAVLERGGLAMVVVATPEGHAATRVVTLGAVFDGNGDRERVEILSGLAGGEIVVLDLTAPPPAGAELEIRS